MIDAGSMGSRIHVYKFNNWGPSAAYEYEVFRNLQPGLSHYKSSPQQAAESLDELMDEAVKVVPKNLQKCTPVAVRATAGLRLLGEKQSKDILDAAGHKPLLFLIRRYVSALLKELLRWGCPFPFGIPKRMMEGDVYRGYFVPAGATVVENVLSLVFDRENVAPGHYSLTVAGV